MPHRLVITKRRQGFTQHYKVSKVRINTQITNWIQMEIPIKTLQISFNST